MSSGQITIEGRVVSLGQPCYLIAELSANHNHDLDRALQLIDTAAASGADAIKIQTYTADTLTIDSDQPWFRIGAGTLWEGRTLHDLYGEAFTPWEWTEALIERAQKHGLALFSTPFDVTAVEFLEQFDPPAYKIASFELVDLDLIRVVAATGRPIIMSTGMASLTEIDDAVAAARSAGADELLLLRCNSAYPASPGEMDLNTIPHMRATWGVPVGLSDHTLNVAAAVTAVALGGCAIEKHFTDSREVPGPDSAFSLEPHEFRTMVDVVRDAERALGNVRYGPTPSEEASLAFRRSLFVVEDVLAGEGFTTTNVRCIRPGHGLPPKNLAVVLGRTAATDIARGTPLSWGLLS